MTKQYLHSIQLWNAIGGVILRDIRPAHDDLITAIAINDTTLMTVSDDGYIKLWN
jgi:WD40 repeat protein